VSGNAIALFLLPLRFVVVVSQNWLLVRRLCDGQGPAPGGHHILDLAAMQNQCTLASQ
jgi:hypothetical protein